MEFIQNRGLINRFLVGSDPEFVIGGHNGEALFYSSNLRLDTAAPFGADLDGRLVELRPRAYRSVLKGLASLQASMQWLAMHPDTMHAGWYCPVVDVEGRALGGHIHFGRKTATRKAEVEALDRLYAALVAAETFDFKGSVYRHDNSGYGKVGDVRIQKYGFEYRAMPSWLTSPYTAMVVLTLAKLAVFEAEAFCPDAPALFTKDWKAGDAIATLTKTLLQYENVDSDAAISLAAIRKRQKFPSWEDVDFRAAWGIGFPLGSFKHEVTWFPRTITPDKERIEALKRCLVQGTPLEATIPIPTWAPTVFPEGWARLLISGIGFVELGELLWGLVTPSRVQREHKVQVVTTNHPGSVIFYTPNPKVMQAIWNAHPISKQITAAFDSSRSIKISLSRTYRQPEYTGIFRKFLTSGCFPIWPVTEDLTIHQYKTWRKALPTDNLYRSKQLAALETTEAKTARQSSIAAKLGLKIPLLEAAVENSGETSKEVQE